jgi:deoxycytidine triphosphate deaminase
MILSNVELHRALDDGRLVIKPDPQLRFVSVSTEHCPYDTHSVDLRLGDEISVPQPGTYAYDQLIVEEVRGIPHRNDGQFQNQATPDGKVSQ